MGGHHDGRDTSSPLLLPSADGALLPDGIPPARCTGVGTQPAPRDGRPGIGSQVPRDHLRSRREDVTLVLYLDNRHRFVGHAVVTVGWVQAARLSAHPVVLAAQACRAAGSVLVRYRRYEPLSATKAEQASFRGPSSLPAALTGSLWSITSWSSATASDRSPTGHRR